LVVVKLKFGPSPKFTTAITALSAGGRVQPWVGKSHQKFFFLTTGDKLQHYKTPQ
jgi:hypothetical protein